MFRERVNDTEHAPSYCSKKINIYLWEVMEYSGHKEAAPDIKHTDDDIFRDVLWDV